MSDGAGDGHFNPGAYAAIDIGTVTCRLLVAEVGPDGCLSEILRDREVANLGMGVDETGRLAPDSIERVGSAIDRFASQVAALSEDGLPVSTVAIATSAARDASNSDKLVARLAQAGVNLRIIPGQKEAALSFIGATSVFPGAETVVIDVGGGSTEIIAGVAGDTPVRAHSFQIGCRRVTERFFKEDPPSAQSAEEAAHWMRGEFSGYLGELREAGLLGGQVIAVAGTATNVVSMRDEMAVYDSDAVHGQEVTRPDIDALVERLRVMPLSQRECVVGLEPRRAPVIVAGLLILQQIMEVAAIDRFTVSEFDILQGVILDAARTQR